jgi:hypothetical protein
MVLKTGSIKTSVNFFTLKGVKTLTLQKILTIIVSR